MTARAKLLFIAPWFLFPKSNGGRIRTVDILRGLKGGQFEVSLVSPDSPDRADYRDELEQVCDRFVPWPAPGRSPVFKYLRLRHLLSHLPVSIATDDSRLAAEAIREELAREPDVAVCDFLHTAVLIKERPKVPSVLFTHNVEAEIFRRHAEVASNPLSRFVWRDQLKKMERFERAALRRFDKVVAVSERDRCKFEEQAPGCDPAVIPTGVDLDYFAPGKVVPQMAREPAAGNRVVFTGSMDWTPNIDAISYFLQQVWPIVLAEIPDAEFEVVGRDPPGNLVQQAARSNPEWRFTGFVKDVRPYVQASDLYVIPLRIGGGTRLKVFEAMAMGCPIVSTSIGVEGLPVVPGQHYARADSAQEFAAAVIELLRDRARRDQIARAARGLVEEKFSSRDVARVFEAICTATAGLGDRAEVEEPVPMPKRVGRA